MKTTIIGLLCAAAAAIQGIVQQGHDVTDWKTWILPVALAILGYLAKDATKTPPPAILLLLSGILFLPSCAGTEYITKGYIGSPFGSLSSDGRTATYTPPAPSVTFPIRGTK